ncbi:MULTISPECIES: restriction endonuclease [unclassified Oscillibacter]|uniref:restriction endonuclease n=1 Tax=unclassified Oscillibacter TaxID=2629304 RepID=UPI0025F52D04|nr:MULTISPECIES: restriction endonuclease [unclassified Oscillibacter]
MGVSVAEYLGQRTDVAAPNIVPVNVKSPCPFSSGNNCMKTGGDKNPVCSVRKEDGTYWIVCENRLCTTKKDIPLCAHQQTILLDIAQHVFSPTITADQVLVKREEQLRVSDTTNYKADYIMTINDGHSPFPGPDRVILEMQGGGETSGTEKLTNIVKAWKRSLHPTNAFLCRASRASTLETNAWRRQQEQFIVKGNIAMLTWKGYGIAFCVGTLLYDYLSRKIDFRQLPDLHAHNWTLALIGIKEDVSRPATTGPVPLIVDDTRLLYTNYQTFVHALINQGLPSPDAFTGNYINLNNHPHVI